MIQHIIPQTVARNGVIDVIIFIGVPVVRQLFRAKHQNRLVAVLIIFDNSQRSEGLAQAYAVR